MAKTMSAIKVDFDVAKKQADQLDDIAGKLERLVNEDLGSCLDNIGANWKSDNATEYIKKGQAVGTNITTAATSLRTTAGTIRTIAQNIYDAEKAAIEAVKKKSSGKK